MLSPRLVNELRVGFNRYRLDYTGRSICARAQLGNKLGVPNANVTPNEQNLPIFSPVDLFRYWADPIAAHLPPRKYL